MITASVMMLRLSTGEDIIGMVSETETDYQIITPFKVIFRRFATKTVGLSAIPWMPDELLDEHTIAIPKSHVVCMMTPKKEFIDHYHRVSDEFYMTLVDLDGMYRKQLSTLDTRPRVSASPGNPLEEYLANQYSSRHPESFDEEYYDDEDEEPPTFH